MEENAKVVYQNDEVATTHQEAVEKTEDLAADTQQDTNDSVDYKTLYEEELERAAKIAEERDNYKQGLLNEKDINKKKIVSQEKSIEDDDVDMFIANKVQEEVAKHLKPLQEQTILGTLSKLSGDVYEQKMIKHYYDTGIIKTGDVETDLKRARALVRDSVMEKKSKEIKRVQENIASVGDIGSSSAGSTEQVNDSFWTKEQEASIRARGLDPEIVKKNFLQG